MTKTESPNHAHLNNYLAVNDTVVKRRAGCGLWIAGVVITLPQFASCRVDGDVPC